MNGSTWAALPSIVVAAIMAGAAIASQRAASRASIKGTETSSRVAIETQAFERAKSFYTDMIDRQAQEVRDLNGDVATLKKQVDVQAGEIRGLRTELDNAKRALRRAFPDEP